MRSPHLRCCRCLVGFCPTGKERATQTLDLWPLQVGLLVCKAGDNALPNDAILDCMSLCSKVGPASPSAVACWVHRQLAAAGGLQAASRSAPPVLRPGACSALSNPHAAIHSSMSAGGRENRVNELRVYQVLSDPG